MNQKTRYEITITQKLEQLPVPDLSELIWSRIEQELDADPGDITDGDNSSPSSPLGGIIIGSVILIAFVTFLINFFNTKKQNTVPPLDNIRQETPTTIRELNSPDDGNVSPTIPPGRNKPEIPNDQAVLPDTVAVIIPTVTDSAAPAPDTLATIVPPPAPAVKDSIPTKKSRGVKGISADDYKIVPKKDNAN